MNDKDVVNESGIALGKKVILYTCSAARIFPDEDRFIHLLAKIAERRDALLLVRLHPTERQAEYRELFGSDPRIILDTPSGEFAAAAVNNLDAGLKGVRRFVAVIRRADVVINLASTISLDAILFDRPVICPAFNLDPGLQGQWNDAQRWYESSHFEAIARSKAVKVVYNQDELQLAVDECLEEPFADHAKREQILREFTGDGSHSTREILATLSERAPTSHN
jgi:CDP-glycerol glycerophosphotransferase (TagB/SpsB family)